LAEETEVFGENMSRCRFVHNKFHMTWPGLEPWPPEWLIGTAFVISRRDRITNTGCWECSKESLHIFWCAAEWRP
jgi:hypothetical protein